MQAVIVIGNGSPAVEAILALRKVGYGSHIVTLSNNASSGFIKALGDKARGIIVTQVFVGTRHRQAADPGNATGCPRAGHDQHLARHGGGLCLRQGAGRRTAAPRPTSTARGLHDALESIRQYDLGGMELNYSSTNHSGLEYTELSIIGPDGRFQR